MVPVATPEVEALLVLLTGVPGLGQPRHEIECPRPPLGLFEKRRAQTRYAPSSEGGPLGGEPRSIAQLASHEMVPARERAEEHAEAHRVLAIVHVPLAEELLEPKHVARIT